MTRINTVPPEILFDEWLIAEYRELPRVISKVRRGKYANYYAPKFYKMGQGHEKFFINKLLYLKRRHDNIREEMSLRFGKKYAIVVDIQGLPEELCNDWVPEVCDHRINIDRLWERFVNRKRHYHMEGQRVDEFDFNDFFGEVHEYSDRF